MPVLFVVLIFLAWGSHLNSLAYRLLNLQYFFKHRSFCPHCKKTIAWYDNIPVLSWLYLRAQCRSCKQSISWLYPCIEIITTTLLYLLWITTPSIYFPLYFIFFSALIVTIRTDVEELLISRFMTLYIIPLGLYGATTNLIPITPFLSISGAIFGYSLLWCAKKLTLHLTQQDGLGQGDLDLLAFIGAFTGPVGCWFALLLGSISGSIISLLYMAITQERIDKIPFGAYLSFGAIFFVLFQKFFMLFIMTSCTI